MAKKNIQELTDDGIVRILESILSKDSINKDDTNTILKIETLMKERNKVHAEEARATEAAKKADTEQQKLKLEREKFEAESKINKEKLDIEREKLKSTEESEKTKTKLDMEKFEAESKINKEKLDIEREKLNVEREKLKSAAESEKTKAELDRERILAAKAQLDADIERMDKEYKANLIKAGASIGTSILGVLAFSTMFYDGLEFEKNDVITSSFLSNVAKGISTKFIKID